MPNNNEEKEFEKNIHDLEKAINQRRQFIIKLQSSSKNETDLKRLKKVNNDLCNSAEQVLSQAHKVKEDSKDIRSLQYLNQCIEYSVDVINSPPKEVPAAAERLSGYINIIKSTSPSWQTFRAKVSHFLSKAADAMSTFIYGKDIFRESLHTPLEEKISKTKQSQNMFKSMEELGKSAKKHEKIENKIPKPK